MKRFIIVLTILFLFATNASALYNAVMLPKFKWFDGNGDPASGWLVNVYEAGTTTRKTSYTTSDANSDASANANPVVLNSVGEANIWIDVTSTRAKLVITDADGANSVTIDYLDGAAPGAVLTSTMANLAAITDGSTDGELIIDRATGNLYTWDNDNTDWRIMQGNRYTTAALPVSATYTIETGTIVFDTTVNRDKWWDGDSWEMIPDYDYIWVGASAMATRSTNGAFFATNEYATNDIMKDYYAYDSSTVEGAQVSLVMPDDWNRSTVKVKAYWSSATGSSISDSVNWLISGVALADSDAMDTTTGAAVTITDAILAVNGGDLQVTDASAAITIAGSPGADEIIMLEVLRNVYGGGDDLDDMAEDAWLFGIMVQYGRSKGISAW